VEYSHPNSTAFARDAMHPAVAYELIGDLLIMLVLWQLWTRNVKSGVIFSLAFLLYAIMRFFVSFLRIDSEEPFLGLSVPQLVSLAVIPIAGLLTLFFLLRKEPARGTYTPTPRRDTASRAERRRRLRAGSRG
jgi:phosphatidylglycerol:prolipoprotein diacylglycerol transferase